MRSRRKNRIIITFAVVILILFGVIPCAPTVAIVYAAETTLSGSESYTAQDGDVLTGSTSGTVTIADGAKITLNNATITGGIVCDGSATITLVGTNNVSGATYKAGIQIGGSGTTLIIKGNGSLTANGGSQSAGIGLSRAWDVDATGGDIIIEGGNITATGDNFGAGIGTGVSWGNTSDKTATIGNITIKGGSVRAIGGTHQYFPGSGIGKGGAYSYGHAVVGTITIYDGIDMVDATSISESVTYMHDETDVTANASNYFTITEDGNRRIIAPKDDTDYTITIANGIEHGSLTGAATAKYMEKVTITATPDLGYRLSRLVVKDADNNDVATTGNTFLMPKGDVTVSAVFEQGTHGTTEFAWGYFGPDDFVTEATIYDGVTTVNLQQGQSYQILKYDNEYSYRKFLLDNDTYNVTIPYSGGTGTFPEYGNGTNFRVDYNGESGYYDITMTDAGNGKWSVSILKTVGVIDNIPDQTYTGSEITPEPLVTAGSLSLTKGMDYVYSYTNNTNIGTATVRATFQGDYASLGYVEKTFNITRRITISDSIENGTVEADKVGADEGDTVTLTITPNAGYQVRNVSVKDASDNDVELTDIQDGTYSFTMPNGNVTVSAEFEAIQDSKPEFKSHTLLLSGQIGVNFYMDLSMLTADEKAAAVMEFTVNGKKTTDNFDAGCLNPSSGNYYGFTCYINAVQMADEITAVLKYGDGKTVSQTYSVAEYISYINEHPDGYSNNTIRLVQAIADYGHYSQPFLASNNSWTLGTDHVVMNGCNLYDISDAEAAKTAVSGHVFTSDTGDSMVEKVTYSLSLESETVLNIYLKMKEGYTGSVTASVGGNAVDAIQQSDGRYRIQIKNIAADKLGDIYEIAISAGGNCTVTASALSYVNAVLNSEKESLNNDTAHYAVTALYRYYMATKNYAENPTE